MQTVIYDSDAFCVLQLDWNCDAAADAKPRTGGGFEIIDKLAGKEIFIDGLVADGFRERVQQLVEQSPSAEQIDDLLDGFSALSRQSLLQH